MATGQVYHTIAAITQSLGQTGISKGRRNQQQGYAFRGVEDVFKALNPLLAEHRLIVVPRMMERTVVERETQLGGVLFYVTVRGEFDFVSAEDGSTHTAATYGEAMDSADKATNKAMSAAYKYAAFLTFCIPTEGIVEDADETTPEQVQPKSPRSGLSSDQPWPEDFDTLLEELRLINDKAELTKWCNATAEQRGKWPKPANDKMRGHVVEQQNWIKSLPVAPNGDAGASIISAG